MKKIVILIMSILVYSACNGRNAETANKSDNDANAKSRTQSAPEKTQKESTAKKTSFDIIRIFDHDNKAFTQGLIYSDGLLYESTGQRGQSTLRKLNLTTGEVLTKIKVNDDYFAEGLTLLNGKLYQLTWVSKVCLIYDYKTMKQTGKFDYEGEGWGITTDGKNLIMSDGTNLLKIIDPKSYKVIKTIPVVDVNGVPISNLNELEYVNGELFANIWMSSNVARINLATGTAEEMIDFSSLWNYLNVSTNTDVLNGIAYNPETKTYYMTGKNWNKLFEIRFSR